MTYRKGDRLGDWTLTDDGRRGGNARVFLARRDDGTDGAVKVFTGQLDGDRYRRFVREVAFHKQGPRSGVLPMLDAHLPDSPAGADPPWFAMPPALVAYEALHNATLENVVDAASAWAETLAALHADGIFHRDLKPANLFQRDGAWLVGDFGLVTSRDFHEELTSRGEVVGPRYFLAYEMLIDAGSAAAGPADVYSLAKSLWVLASHERYPPFGHQSADDERLSIAFSAPHARARLLDDLVDRATAQDGAERPTMSEFHADLIAWTALGDPAPSLVDLGPYAARAQERLDPLIRAASRRERRDRALLALTDYIDTLVGELDGTLRALFPGLAQRTNPTMGGMNSVASNRPPAGSFSEVGIQVLAPNSSSHLTLGIIYFLINDPTTNEPVTADVRGMVVVSHLLASAWQQDVILETEPRAAPIGSIAVRAVVRGAMSELRAILPDALTAFGESIH